MSKKTNLEKFGHLPRLTEDHTEEGGGKQRDKINAHKDRVKDFTTSELAHEYTRLRDEKDDIEDELKALNAKLTAVTEMLTDRFESEELTSIGTANGYRVSSQVKPYASVKDKEAWLKWVHENGYDSNLSVPWQTMNSITTQLLEGGYAPPDGVEVYLKSTFRLSRG